MAIRSRLNLDIGNELNAHAMKLIHYFAEDTTEKILNNIDRLDIHDTGALRNSIRSMVHYNAGGNSALVQFYMLEYGNYVALAVGKYHGVDSDLGKGVGVKKSDIDIPPIGGVGYGALQATFNLPPNARREETHKPRPFFMNEIRRGVERISYRLLEELGNTIEIHMMQSIVEGLFPPVDGYINEVTWTPNRWRNGSLLLKTRAR